MKEHDEIMGIQDREEVFRLRLGTPYYLDAIRPFLKLCEMHRDDTETDLRYRDVSLNEGIEELAKFNLDVVFIAILKSQIVGVRNGCKQNNLTMIPIGELPAVINMRKDHPAALDGRAEKISQGCDLMKEYPYIVDRILNEDNTSTSYNDSDFVQCGYKIMSDEVDIRRRLAACTNGFFFGMQPSKGINEQYGTVSFPVPGVMMEISCLVRSDDVDRMEIKEYIQLLKEELNINDKKGAVAN